MGTTSFIQIQPLLKFPVSAKLAQCDRSTYNPYSIFSEGNVTKVNYKSTYINLKKIKILYNEY